MTCASTRTLSNSTSSHTFLSQAWLTLDIRPQRLASSTILESVPQLAEVWLPDQSKRTFSKWREKNEKSSLSTETLSTSAYTIV